jgi:hypothetical protein
VFLLLTQCNVVVEDTEDITLRHNSEDHGLDLRNYNTPLPRQL